MRIDHGPVQAMQAHHPPPHGDLPLTTTSVHPPENFRLICGDAEESMGANREMCPVRLGSKVDGFERKGQQWFVATELQSDLVVEVGEMSFHLHKFPLLSRSGKLNRLVFDTRDVENSHIKLDDMPGGPETFELAAKFCYGVAVELTAANVASLRCAAEYLEMTEDLEEGNLISKTEAFLTFVVLASWKDSITVLQSSEKLLPWAEHLQIVRRCCESIAWKACTDPRGIRWSFTERAAVAKKPHPSPIWTGPKVNNSNSMSEQVPSDWWFEDICVVCVSFFTKIISAIKVKGMRYDLIGSAIVHYAIRWLPGLTRDFVVMSKDPKEPTMVDGSFLHLGGTKEKDGEGAKSSELSSVHEKNKVLVETLVGIIPSQKDAVPCTFLLRMLRLAKMLSINPSLITDLEKRAGLLLDQGTLSDLLIPSFDHTCETLFDVDLVQRLLDYFLLQDFSSPGGTESPAHSDKDKSGISTPGSDKMHPQQSSYSAKMRVAKLIDNYLAEVGRDQNLTLNKFLALAEALPEHTRVTDDGLYKALDTYLKAHPLLSEHERKKLCRTLDCQRLSLDACMHAAQNERLPLRVVVQVLFGEQIKLRNAVTGTSTTSKDLIPHGHYPGHEDEPHSPRDSTHAEYTHGHHHDAIMNPDESEEEIRVLRSDMEKMKGKFLALQHDYAAMQQQLEKLTKHPKGSTSHDSNSHSDSGESNNHHHHHHHHHSGWKKLIPHPHFHMPHMLTHPLDIFKDHHHGHGKDHHHGHGKDGHHGHKDKDGHHGHGKDGHHGHGKDGHQGHGKDNHHSHGKDSYHSHGKSSHHGHGKDSHQGHKDNRQHGKDHHSHGHRRDNTHHHHGHVHPQAKDAAHEHHSSRHHHHDISYVKENHHEQGHSHGSKKVDGADHHIGPDRHQHHASGSDLQSSQDLFSVHHHHYSKEISRHSRDDDVHHVKKDEYQATVKAAQHSEMAHPHTAKESGAEFYQHSKSYHHQPKEPNGLEHHHHRHPHHGKGSQGHLDYPLSLPDPSAAGHHQKTIHEEHRTSKDSTHSSYYHPDQHKDGEPRYSSSHMSSGEDSSRSMDGPTTPTHPIEHKKTRPFANAIRKWRNSIS